MAPKMGCIPPIICVIGTSTILRVCGVARGAEMGVETWAEVPTKGPSDWVSWVAETLEPAKNRLARVAADSAFVAFMVLLLFVSLLLIARRRKLDSLPFYKS